MKHLLLTAILIIASTAWAEPIDESKTADMKEKRLAAAQGDAKAQYWVGFAYSVGLGVAQDYAEAFKWYRLSAAQGDADAQFDLGLFYANGSGVLQDYAEALKWYKLAAAQGHVFADWNLGYMYENGKGVQKDDVRAHMWYNIMGLKLGGRNDLRISVERRLTTKQITEAQKLARECQARNFAGC